jgi:hypothetical protein
VNDVVHSPDAIAGPHNVVSGGCIPLNWVADFTAFSVSQVRDENARKKRSQPGYWLQSFSGACSLIRGNAHN